VKPLRVIDTFSGIGGFTLAGEQLGGFETICFVEREPYCQKILRKHWSHIPIHNDIRTFEPEMGSADVICGGFPCQDISLAGKQAGIHEGTRSGLFYELMRVVRLVRPRFIVLENVSAILSNGLDTVLGELVEAGFDAEWACIPASAVGACHRRDRWWLIAYSQDLLSNGSPSQQQRQFGRQSFSKFGDSDRADAADSLHNGLQRCNLSSSAKCKPYQGREISLGSGETFRAQQWPNEKTRGDGLNPDWRSYVSQPVLCRGDDGLSGRVDRLKALGNAVVPQVAAIPLLRVRQLAGA